MSARLSRPTGPRPTTAPAAGARPASASAARPAAGARPASASVRPAGLSNSARAASANSAGRACSRGRVAGVSTVLKPGEPLTVPFARGTPKVVDAPRKLTVSAHRMPSAAARDNGNIIAPTHEELSRPSNNRSGRRALSEGARTCTSEIGDRPTGKRLVPAPDRPAAPCGKKVYNKQAISSIGRSLGRDDSDLILNSTRPTTPRGGKGAPRAHSAGPLSSRARTFISRNTSNVFPKEEPEMSVNRSNVTTAAAAAHAAAERGEHRPAASCGAGAIVARPRNPHVTCGRKNAESTDENDVHRPRSCKRTDKPPPSLVGVMRPLLQPPKKEYKIVAPWDKDNKKRGVATPRGRSQV